METGLEITYKFCIDTSHMLIIKNLAKMRKVSYLINITLSESEIEMCTEMDD